LIKDEKAKALGEVLDLADGRAALGSLVARQEALALAAPDTLFGVGRSIAPFVTGMGIEHPTENGFVFLDPYGLPYLAGSGVKGVLRRAAEELALFDGEPVLSILDVWWLFGFDASSAMFVADQKDGANGVNEERQRWRDAYDSAVGRIAAVEAAAFFKAAGPADPPDPSLRELRSSRKLRDSLHVSGALRFWDVIPEPPAGTLREEILNPHYGHYYQQGQPPGDWGDPKPIFYLSVPEDSTFRFVVQFAPPKECPRDLAGRWRALAEQMLGYAFDWLGFGGKTRLGMGGLARAGAVEAEAPNRLVKLRQQAEQTRQKREGEQARLGHEREAEERRKRIESLSGVDRTVAELEQEVQHLTASNQLNILEQKTNERYAQLDTLSGGDQQKLAAGLRVAFRALGKWEGKLTEKQQKKVSRIRTILGER
jgi:CRISPR-associated protein Cmr6